MAKHSESRLGSGTEGTVKQNGPLSQFPNKGTSWIIYCQISQAAM